MANEKVTSLQVAQRAGVSQSAVSRVFTPGASASPRTAEKVRAAAEELGYRPNAIARAMITGKSRIIGLVVAYLDNYFYPDAIERLSVALQAQGYHVLVFMAARTVGDVQEVVQEILDYQVDGIVLASVAMSSSLAAQCQMNGIPVVLFNRDQDDPRLSSVTTANQDGGRAVADHLIATGHRRIAYLAGYDGASTQRDRELGFNTAMAQQGQPVFARGIGNFRQDETRAAVRAMFADPANRPEALFVCNDHMAFAAMDTLRFELGLKIPQDVSVIGFDDVPVSAWPAYDLTTFRQPVDQMVAETVSTLIERIETPENEPRRIRLQGRLVVRGSCRAVAGT